MGLSPSTDKGLLHCPHKQGSQLTINPRMHGMRAKKAIQISASRSGSDFM